MCTMTDFTKMQHLLKRHGWEEGKGLGKNENGITEALKPICKFDKAGIGYNNNDNTQWWETVYNNAAKNIKVESHDDKVSLSVIDKNWDPAFPGKSTKVKCEYGNFMKTSTLVNGCLVQDASAKLEEEKTTNNPVPLTDEQLYIACDGRTMHATARHGITLSGKLDRIAQQDELFQRLNDVFKSKTSSVSLGPTFLQNIMTPREINIESEKEESEREDNHEKSSPEVKYWDTRSKGTKKRQKRRVNKLADQLNNFDLEDNKKDERNFTDDEIKQNTNLMCLPEPVIIEEKWEKLRSEKISKKSANYRKLYPKFVDHYKFLDQCSKAHPNINKFEKRKSRFQQAKKIKMQQESINMHNYARWHVERAALVRYKNDETLKKEENKHTKYLKEMEVKMPTKSLQESAPKFLINDTQSDLDDLYYWLRKKVSRKKFFDSITFNNRSKDKIAKDIPIQNKSLKKNDHSKQIKPIEKVVEKLRHSVVADNLNTVIKNLMAVNITEEVKASVFKKKPTQTHLKPV